MAVDINGDGLIGLGGTSTTQGRLRLYEDTDNGTNYVGLQAPASIASDVTWTLPNADGSADQVLKTDGSGALGWATPSSGKILQVLTAVDTNNRTTTSTSFVTGSNTASVTITPSSASNKIYVVCSGNLSCNDGNDGWVATIFRGATNLGNATSGLASGNSVPGVSATFFPFCMTVLDSPNTTSATTYQLQFKVIDVDSDSGTASLGSYVNGSSNYVPTHITVFEVAA